MASEIQLPTAQGIGAAPTGRSRAAPTVNDVQQVRPQGDPGLRVPDFSSSGAGIEKAGQMLEHGALSVGHALERQQKEQDAINITKADLELKKTGMEEFQRLQSEADTTNPEFVKNYSDWIQKERERITAALSTGVSDYAKKQLDLKLEQQSISFTHAAGTLHLAAAQAKSHDLIQQQGNVAAAQASRDPDSLPIILEDANKNVEQFVGTMSPNAYRDALSKTRQNVIQSAVSGLVKNDRYGDAEKLIGTGEYDKDLGPAAVREINADIHRGKQAAKMEIRDVTNDHLASLSATGVGVPGLSDRAQKILDPKDFANFKAAEGTAKHVFNVSQTMTFATPQQIDQQLKSLEPRPGSTHFADEERAYNGVAQQANRIMKARHDDPVGFAMQDPKVADAFKKAGDDPTQLPMAVNRVLAAQENMGIPEQDRRVLSKDGADTVVKQLGQMPPEKMADNIQAMAQSYGKYWGRAFKELVGQHLPAEAQILGTMDRPEDAVVRKDFAVAVQTGRKTLTDNLGPQMKKTIDDGLQSALEPWARTELARGATDVNVQSMRSAAEMLAYSYASRGMDPSKAATAAAQGMVLNRYDVLDQSGFSLYAPKGQGSQVSDTGTQIKSALTVKDVIDPGGAPELTSDQRKSAYLNKAKNGKWVLNEGGDGAVLLDEIGQPVMTRKSNFDAATSQMSLTPQEQNLYQHHLGNLDKGGVTNNGKTSTALVAGVEVNGREYNIPTVWDNKIVGVDEAVKRAKAEGIDKFPSYTNPDEAYARYMKMHDFMERDLPQRMEFKFSDMDSIKAGLPAAPSHRGTSNSIRRTVGAAEPSPVQKPAPATSMSDGVTLP